MASNYKTKQGTIIEDTFRTGRDYSVQELVAALRKSDVNISIPTIYRHIGRMVKSGKLNSYYVDGSNRFKLISDDKEAAQLRCKLCGKTIILECTDLKMFTEHIEKEHAFIIDTDSVFFYGICNQCQEKKEYNFFK